MNLNKNSAQQSGSGFSEPLAIFELFPLQCAVAYNDAPRKLSRESQISICVNVVFGILNAIIFVGFLVVAVKIQIFGIHVGEVNLCGYFDFRAESALLLETDTATLFSKNFSKLLFVDCAV